MQSSRKKNIAPQLARLLLLRASEVDKAKMKMRATPEAARYREEQKEFARVIATATKSAKTAEDLEYLADRTAGMINALHRELAEKEE